MPKFFKKLPAEFEKYNPEVITITSSSVETFDDQGLYHSYNDQPASFVAAFQEDIFAWFNHGVMTRENNKPYKVSFKKDTYETFNKNNRVHSYGDFPSGIYGIGGGKGFHLEWKKDGVLHRPGNLPALINWMSDRHSRTNKFPGLDGQGKRVWGICGEAHNKNGPIIVENTKHNVVTKEYGLYGVKLPLEAYERIHAYHLAKKVPLWFAFLYEFDLISEEIILPLGDELSTMISLAPLKWIIHSFGITNETLSKAVTDKSAKYPNYAFTRNEYLTVTRLDSLIKIVEFEKEYEENSVLNDLNS
jgi:hypothetical protein